MGTGASGPVGPSVVWAGVTVDGDMIERDRLWSRAVGPYGGCAGAHEPADPRRSTHTDRIRLNNSHETASGGSTGRVTHR